MKKIDKMKTQTYRPDIDGLRSIAVLLVLFYHAGLKIFPGGFIGVDVFFVISGYLISTIIYREISEGTFTFRQFYKRRIQRLTPALFTVLFAVTIAAYFILLPNDLYSYTKSLLAAALSVSNIFLWREYGGYFDGGSENVPLLHTWSLSIEEQYYLIWPIYLIIFYKLFPKRLLLPATVFIFFASLFLSQWVANITFGASYYLLPTRMFQLAAGSIMAIIWAKIPATTRYYNDFISIVGIILIIGSALLLNKSSLFPGFNAVYVTIGTSMLIYSGKENIGIINKILSLKPFVFIGLISYSLYLWHWPIIVYTRYTGVKITPYISAILIIISIVIAWISWKFVEQQFRYGKKYNFQNIFIRLFLAPLFILMLIVGYFYCTGGATHRYSADILLMDKAIASKPEISRNDCHSTSRQNKTCPRNDCRLGVREKENIDAFMIGDSHANHFTGFIDEIAKKSKISVQDYTLDACLPVFDLYWGRNGHYANLCKERNDLSIKHIEENHFSYVILAGEWPNNMSYKSVFVDNRPLDSEEKFKIVFMKAFQRTIKTIVKSGAVPVIIKDNPLCGNSGPRCSINRVVFGATSKCETLRSEAEKNAAFMDFILNQIKGEYPQLKVIDPLSVMCDQELCYSELNGIPLYRDSNHLNDISSKELGIKYSDLKGNPFIK
jgi:peptidoglycan/LPS O-acetylase OafA/YrhL